MNTPRRRLVLAVLLLVARLALTAADAPSTVNTSGPLTTVPVVGVWLVPAGEVFQSWLDYGHSLRMESGELGGATKFAGVKITSMETVIRRADTGQQVARIPFQGAIGSEVGDERPGHVEFTADIKTYDARATALPDAQAKALDKNPPGEYLLAVYINGVRASNVVKIRIDPAFDTAKAPTLQLGGIEAHPRTTFGRLVLWAIGPTPADPDLTNFRLTSCPIIVDGVERQPPGMGYSGPRPRPLTSGQRYPVLINSGPSNRMVYDPAYDSSQPHTFTLSYTPANQGQPGGRLDPSSPSLHYTAPIFSFDPRTHPLSDAWDKFSPPEESRPIAPSADAAIKSALQLKMSQMVFSSATLSQITSVISQITGVKIILAPDAAAKVANSKYSFQIQGWTMAQTLDAIGAATGLVYHIEGDSVVFHLAPKGATGNG